MDLSLHSFILVIGLVVMAFILWDGIKKVKQSRANKLRIKLDDQFDDLADGALGSEFPNGGARTLGGTQADAPGDKYDEFEFDDTLLSAQQAGAAEPSLDAPAQLVDADVETETYVTADLLNDVEQELAAMDQTEPATALSHTEASDGDADLGMDQLVALDATESGLHSKLETKLEPKTASSVEPSFNEEADTARETESAVADTVTATVKTEAPILPTSLLEAKTAEPNTLEPITLESNTLEPNTSDDDAEPPLVFHMSDREHSESKPEFDFSAIASKLTNTSTNTQANKPASAANTITRDALTSNEKSCDTVKGDAEKIDATKKQLAAKQAYREAVKTEHAVTQQGRDNSSAKNTSKSGRESVPMLMDPVELGGAVDPNPPQQKELTLPAQPDPQPVLLGSDEDDYEHFSALDDDGLYPELAAQHAEQEKSLKQKLEKAEKNKPVSNQTKPIAQDKKAEKLEKTDKPKSSKGSFFSDRLRGDKQRDKAFESTAELDPLFDEINTHVINEPQVGERLKDRPAAQEVLVINVLKDDGKPLQGRDLHHVFNVCDLRFGEMNIFHRFEQANAKGKIQFSVANGVEPGTFDPATLDESSTTGISFFMSLPGPEHPMEAFDAMLEVAHVFARNFNAELHDDSHSDLTPQTIEHCRHRIREFSRKQKMKATKA